MFIIRENSFERGTSTIVQRHESCIRIFQRNNTLTAAIVLKFIVDSAWIFDQFQGPINHHISIVRKPKITWIEIKWKLRERLTLFTWKTQIVKFKIKIVHIELHYEMR